MIKIIYRILNNKALELDEILNYILKIVEE